MSKTFSILYLDDEEDNLISFKAVFRRYYNIHTALSPDDAFNIINENNIDLVISDQRMPKQTGVEFFESLNIKYPEIVRMILTGYSDIQAIIDAINKGKIYYYITKPWNFEELKVILDNALETYNLKNKNKQLEVENQKLLMMALQQEKAQLASKYEVLKNQINPHFLFNCLNTLSSLIASDTHQAIKFTTRFAKMYRYLLEYGDEKLISLYKEIELIETYLFLQKIRFGDTLSLHIEIENYNFCLPPFALQTLVENAIKHNVVNEQYPLNITIKSIGDRLEISNKIRERSSKEHSTGIGINNLKQRYQILLNKEPEIINDGIEFRVMIHLIPEE